MEDMLKTQKSKLRVAIKNILMKDRDGKPYGKVEEFVSEKYLKEFKTDKKLNLSKIIKETENMSGAYLKEIVMVAYMITVEYGVVSGLGY